MKLAPRLKWGMVILIILALVGAWAATTPVVQAQANTWHIATNGSDVTGDGSEAKPFATIQHGIDRASNGDIVLVHPGRYKENIKFKGKNITVASLFYTSTNNHTYIFQTVIDGNRAGRAVTFENGETAAAVLTGLTLTNGYVQGSGTAGSGGGLACFRANPTLTHLIVSNNEAAAEGGGLYFEYCSAKLQDTLITGNTAFLGGGIRYSYGSPSLERVTVAHNTSQSDGAGIQFYHAEASIKNALIAHNAGGAKGGGLMFDGCSPTFTNVTIADNTTSGHGGGLNVSYASHPKLVNSIVWGNSPEQIYFDTAWPGEAVTIQYSDVQGGAAGIVTNNHGPVNWLTGNLALDPLFEGSGDYHLTPDSPAIGAGTPDNAPSPDLADSPRPWPAGSKPDQGAYESPLPAPHSDIIKITNAQELQAIKNNLAGHYYLANDIDCAGIANFEPIGRPGQPFVGTFDGHGHTISHLTINRPGEDEVGLFGRIENASLAQVTLQEVKITGRSKVGSLVGYLFASQVSDSAASGVVTGLVSRIGGLIGESYNGGGIRRCRVEVSVNAQNATEVGGLLGRTWDGDANRIIASFYRGTVNAPGSNQVGGLAGYSKSSDFIRSFVTGQVNGNKQVGGLVGSTTENAGIHNSYAQAAVTGTTEVGGLIGYFNSYHDGISHAYYAGTISGNSTVGGLIGRYSAGTLVNNFWDYQRTGLLSSQDSGNNGQMSGVDGQTTAAMMRQDTFTSWDFNRIWLMVDYPQLQFAASARPTLTIHPPTTATIGDLIYIPVELKHISSALDLRGVQFSLRVTDTAILTPAAPLAPMPGNLFPPGSITSTTLAGAGWDFLLTDALSTPAISGSGVIVSLPFLARNEGCAGLTLTNHQLSNGSAQPIPHSAEAARLCVVGQGNVQGHLYLDWRSSGHYTHTQVMLIGSRQTYTTTTDPAGNFALTHLYAGAYTLQASHPLFVRAQRTVTVTAALTTTVPRLGLWAGDINQNQRVNLYDWYLLAAAIFPVSDPHFDINDDGLTNIQDLVILTLNLGQPNMTTTNPPTRPGLASLDLSQPLITAQSEGQLKLGPAGANEMILRLEEVGEPVYAVGVRLTLPAEATVTGVEASPAFAGGFLEWHQEGTTLYLVVAPPEEQAVTQNTEVAVIRGVTFVAGKTEVVAKNSITAGPQNDIFLPIIIK